MKRFLRQLNRIIFIGIYSLICIYALLYIIISVPYIQNNIKNLAITELEKKLDSKIAIQKIEIYPFNRLALTNVSLCNNENDTIADIGRITASFDLFHEIINRRICINSVQLSKFSFRLNKSQSNSPLNIQYIIDKLKQNDSTDSNLISINIKSVFLRQGRFTYDVLDKNYSDYQFDKNHIEVNNISASAFIYETNKDSLSINLKRFSFAEKGGYKHKNLSFSLNSNYKDFKIENLNIAIDNSVINANNFSFSIKKSDEKQLLIDSTYIDIDLIGNNITPNEFSSFYTKLNDFDKSFDFNVNISGYLCDLYLNKLHIYSSENLNIIADAQINGINNGIDAYIFGRLKKCYISSEYSKKIANIFINNKYNYLLDRIGKIEFDGEISGFFNNLVAFGKLQTDIGIVNTDILIGKNDNIIKYKGNLKSKDFNLYALINNNDFGDISLNFTVDALQNISNNTFNGKIAGDILDFQFKDYTYSNIKCEGKIKNKEFEGNIELDDLNGFLSLDGKIKFDKENSIFNFYANAKNIFLDKLNILPKHHNTSFSFNISSDFIGNKIDNVNGLVVIDSVNIKKGNESVLIPNINFAAYNNETPKAITISSDIINAQIVGEYKFSTFADSFKKILSQTLQFLDDDKNKSKKAVYNNEFEYSLKINSCEQLWPLLLVPISFKETIELSGYYSDRENKNFSLAFDMPDFKYKKIQTKDIHIDFTIPQNRFSLDIEGKIINKKNKPISLGIKSISKSNSINTRINWSNSEKNIYKGTLLSRTSIERKNGDFPLKTEIEIIPSDIIINDSIWKIKNSDIIIDSARIQINEMKIYNQSQYLSINGALSKNINDSISVNLHDIDIDYIFDMINMSYIMFGGNGTGNINISSKDNNIFVNTDSIKIKDFTYNNELMGDLKLSSKIDINNLDIYLSGEIKSDKNISYINGNILPKKDSLHLDFNAEKLNCAFIKIWTDKILHNIKGYASADMSLYGKFRELNLTGKAWTNNISFGIEYLNTRYSIADTISFTKDGIYVNDINLYDSNNSFAKVNGDIKYKHFKDINYNIDINIPANNSFMAFDTNEKINSFYWGTIYASGKAKIEGDAEETKINVNGTTKGNSKFFFALNDNNNAGDYQFIKFNDKNRLTDSDYKTLSDKEPDESQNNIIINLNVDATPDATVNIIMDSSTGDVLKGNGSGNLRLVYNNVDEIKLFGKYNINKGSYYFNFQDFFTREFFLKEGSNIEFSGNPYNTKLDINTYYQITANLSELDESFNDSKEISRTSVPVQCLLNINGDIRKPELDFDINLPTVSQDTDRRIRSIIGTQEMMNKQIIYLMVLNKFYTNDQMSQNQQNRYSDLTSVASSTLSSQLNSLLGQLSDNWNIGTNIRSEKGDFSDVEVQLALSSQLLNNRLLFNGNLGYKDAQTTNNTNSFIGDFDLEYLLTPIGNLRLKAYNHYNDKNYSIKSALTTQGVGIMAKKDFNSISDLFNIFINRKRRNKRNSNTEAE